MKIERGGGRGRERDLTYISLLILAKLKILFISFHIPKPDTVFKNRLGGGFLQDVEITHSFHLHSW